MKKKLNADGTFDLFSERTWYYMIYLKVYWFFRELPWQFKKRFYKIKFFTKIWKMNFAPWDLTDTFPVVIFEMLKYYIESWDREEQMKCQYGSETEEEAQSRYIELFSAYSWYKDGSKIAQQRIDHAWETHHETFPFEFRMRPTDETGQYFEFVDNKDKAARKKSLKSSKSVFEMEDDFCRTQDKHLQNIIKHYRTLWD
jgi:hypothetical protein